MKTDERFSSIYAVLTVTYAEAHCELHHANPFQLLIATILSAQCTDARVNQVAPALFQAFPNSLAMAQAPLEDIEKLIHSTGFFRNKAKNIKNCCIEISAKHRGDVPHTMAELSALPGVGRKTANVVLGNAFDIQEGIVVDTHVSRLSQRMGFTKQTEPEKIERDLMKLVPRTEWAFFSHRMIFHGRRRCSARKPDCAKCEVAHLCPSFGSTKL